MDVDELAACYEALRKGPAHVDTWVARFAQFLAVCRKVKA
jgi:hypothetical protein